MQTASSVQCKACPLWQGRISIVDGSGPMDSPLMVVCEAPGREEDRAAAPLVGQSGRLIRGVLAEICAQLGVDPRKIYYTNSVRCRPPQNRTPLDDELKACLPWLLEEVEEIQPRVILACGNTAQQQVGDVLYALDGDQDGIYLNVMDRMVSVYHPAYILRQRSKLDAWKLKLERAVRLAFQVPGNGCGGTGCGGPGECVCPKGNAEPWVMMIPQQQGMILDPTYLSADTETDDLEDGIGKTRVGWSISDGKRAAFLTEEPLKYPHFYLHEAKYDIPLLGLDPDDLDSYDDTLIMAYPLAQRYGWPFLGLKRTDGKGLAQTLCHVEWNTYLSEMLTEYDRSERVLKSGKNKGKIKVTIKKKKVPFSRAIEVRPDDARLYAATDALGTARLAQVLTGLFQTNQWAKDWYQEFEKPLVPVLLSMEQAGFQIDKDALQAASKVIDQKRAETEVELRLVFGKDINLASGPQMGPALQDMGIVDGKLTDTGEVGVAKDNILKAFGVEKVEDLPDTANGRTARALLDWRGMGKLKSTYVDAITRRLDSTSRLRGQRFNSASTNTSRLSSSDPNLQNIPARTDIGMAIRRAFVAKPGFVLVVGDYSQLQLRDFAEFTHDPIFLDAYCGEEEKDLHQMFTDLVCGWGYPVERKNAKNGVFGTLFGAADQKMAETLGIPLEQAGMFIQRMYQEVPSLVTWASKAAQELGTKGYVESLQGWRCYYPDFGGPVNKWHQAAIREAANAKIQASEAGTVKRLMIRLYNWLRIEHPRARMILQVHDEVAVEAPVEEADDIAAGMKVLAEEVGRVDLHTVPLRMDPKVVERWANAK